jgi:hypothetical protein
MQEIVGKNRIKKIISSRIWAKIVSSVWQIREDNLRWRLGLLLFRWFPGQLGNGFNCLQYLDPDLQRRRASLSVQISTLLTIIA